MIDLSLSYRSNPCDTPLLEETIGEAFERIAQAHPQLRGVVPDPVRHRPHWRHYGLYLSQHFHSSH